MPRLPKLSPATRVALGLVSLMVSLILLSDLLVGFLPDRIDTARRHRTLVAHHLAQALTASLNADGEARLQSALTAAVRDESQLRAVALRRADGQIIARLGDARRLDDAARRASRFDDLHLPITSAGQPWGELQLVFDPVLPQSLLAWRHDPLVQGLAMIAGLGFVAFALYLRRMLRYLDPNSAVPERVRTAFDTLTEAVLVLDPSGRVMLANDAFSRLAPQGGGALTGREVGELDWLVRAVTPEGGRAPWADVVRLRRSHLNQGVTLDIAGRGRRELVMNCAPISDGDAGVRGCLVTFSDVTELHDRTEKLRLAVTELERSRAEIERQNEELERLATRDPLTGCLNRRAMMGRADAAFADARSGGTALTCIMTDIDHFKQVNDKYGHAGGDVVIQAAANALQRGIRVGDFVARYGGEEFCVMLPGATLEQTAEIAERLRADVEAHLGGALREHPGARVTMSFGIAMLDAATADPAALIDFADQALYQSKKGGRNRVTVWEPARSAALAQLAKMVASA